MLAQRGRRHVPRVPFVPPMGLVIKWLQQIVYIIIAIKSNLIFNYLSNFKCFRNNELNSQVISHWINLFGAFETEILNSHDTAKCRYSFNQDFCKVLVVWGSWNPSMGSFMWDFELLKSQSEDFMIFLYKLFPYTQFIARMCMWTRHTPLHWIEHAAANPV